MFTRAFIFAAGIMACFPAYGAPVVSGATITTGEAGDCVLLKDPVVLRLSSGVKASFLCSTNPDVIGVAACHVHGRRNAVLLDGSLTTDGIVYTMRSDGGRMDEVAGCPPGVVEIPDAMVPAGVP